LNRIYFVVIFWVMMPRSDDCMDLRNVGILSQHYTASQSRRWGQHGPPKRRYLTTTLHGVTNRIWKFIAVKISCLANSSVVHVYIEFCFVLWCLTP